MTDFNNQITNNTLPPQNIEAETAILGGILLDKDALGRIVHILTIEAFYVKAHQQIYQACLTLHAQSKPTDLMTVSAWLQDQNILEKIGGINTLAQLVDRTVSAVNIDRYADLIMDKYIRRQLINAGHEITDLGYDTTQELETVFDQAEQKIFKLTQERPQEGLVPIADTLIQTFNNIENLHQNITLPGIPCGFYDLDAYTSGFQRSDLIIVAGRPSMGKCLAKDAEIVLSNGEIITIEQFYQQQKGELLTLNSQWKFNFIQPSAFVDDGIKPIFEIKTRLGKSLKTTLIHPFLTIEGWKKLEDLTVGTKIAVPRQINVFGTEEIPEEKVKLLGKSSYEKTIPDLIFKCKKSLVALFLNRLFATDGWATILNSGQCQIGYGTVNEKLARQIQHLLLRFGIIAKLKKHYVNYQNNQHLSWQLDITDLDSLKTFIEEIGIFSKEEKINEIKEILTRKKFKTNYDVIPLEIWQKIAELKGNISWKTLAKQAGIKGYSNIHVGKKCLSRLRLLKLAYALDNQELKNLGNSDIYWDEIISIEYLGEEQVYDLTIPETHNFVANDICVHNTAIALNMACNIAKNDLPVAIFSLEMSKEQLAQRLLSSETGIESNRLRSGRISQQEFEPLGIAMGALSSLAIYIDDTANLTVTQMRSQVRRLQAEKGNLGLVLLDYLQLMEGGGDNRVQELSRITRSLKGLAREINAPIIALSQLSRGVEQRTNKRPMLSDLRESGCLVGDSLVTLDSGLQVQIKDLIGKSDFLIWALNETTMKLEKAKVSNVFSTGIKPIFKLKTRLGRTIKATGNHQFLTINGWQRLDQLKIKEHIALPRYLESSSSSTMTQSELALLGHLIGDGCTLPRHSIQYTTREKDLANIVVCLANQVFGDKIKPRINPERQWYQVYLTANYSLTHNIKNPVTQWLDQLGIFGLRSYEKFIPNQVFEQSQEGIKIFLRHLWSTDGSIKLVQGKYPRPIAYYSSSSLQLATDVQALLIRFEINARLSIHGQKGKGRDQYHVTITGKPEIQKFIEIINSVGEYKTRSCEEIAQYIQSYQSNPNRDLIPYHIWRLYAVPAMGKSNLTAREMQSKMGNKYCGTSLYKNNLSRERAAKLGQVVQSESIKKLAVSDIYWDEIVSIEPCGEAEVFDLTVPNLHNFIANNIIVHNSIEQDADIVMMLYRDSYYNPDSVDQNIAEIIIAKHRNGPTGTVKLLFQADVTKFENLARRDHY